MGHCCRLPIDVPDRCSTEGRPVSRNAEIEFARSTCLCPWTGVAGGPIDHTEKTVVVIGTGRDIGREISHRFAEAGANVVAAARTESEIRETIDGVETRGSAGLALPTGVRDPDDAADPVRETVDRFGTPDVLVNNAAVHVAGDPLSRSVDDVDAMLGVNLRGVVLLSQAFANAVIDGAGPGGSIVNVSNIVGHLRAPHHARLLRHEGRRLRAHPGARRGARPPRHHGQRCQPGAGPGGANRATAGREGGTVRGRCHSVGPARGARRHRERLPVPGVVRHRR